MKKSMEKSGSTYDPFCPNCMQGKQAMAITLNNTCAICGRDLSINYEQLKNSFPQGDKLK